MKYFIRRDLNEYGPYTLADVQRYVAQGNILLSDLARSEGMNDWVPVSQVLGNIPVPVAATAGTVYGGTATAYGVAASPAIATSLVPVDLHWALVLLFTVITCGLFNPVWMIVIGVFVYKIKPQSKALVTYIVAIALPFIGAFIGAAARGTGESALAAISPLFSLAGLVLQIVAAFSMRSDLEEYYNTTENIGLWLSGVLTFFFPAFYFQYHLSRIAKWKKTGVLEPQN
jgi:GYF domain 2